MWMRIWLGLTLAGCGPSNGELDENGGNGPAPAELVIRHLDVGQADATLVDAPEATILIDAGHWSRHDLVPMLKLAEVDDIDLLILTHPHADHIGQVPELLDAFEVGKVWRSGWDRAEMEEGHLPDAYHAKIEALDDSGVPVHEPRAGKELELGDLRVEVLHPAGALTDIHDNLAIRLVFDGFAAVYTGDAETEHELDMLERALPLSAQVLQLGHHGSSTSSSWDFLQAVDPEVAIYSAEKDSEHGHPHHEVVERVDHLGIELYGTAVNGTVTIRTSGQGYSVEF